MDSRESVHKWEDTRTLQGGNVLIFVPKNAPREYDDMFTPKHWLDILSWDQTTIREKTDGFPRDGLQRFMALTLDYRVGCLPFGWRLLRIVYQDEQVRRAYGRLVKRDVNVLEDPLILIIYLFRMGRKFASETAVPFSHILNYISRPVFGWLASSGWQPFYVLLSLYNCSGSWFLLSWSTRAFLCLKSSFSVYLGMPFPR